MIANKISIQQKAKVDNQNEYIYLNNTLINAVAHTFATFVIMNKEDVVLQPFTTTIIESDVIILKRSDCSIYCNVELMAKTELRLFPQILNRAEMENMQNDVEFLKIEVLNLSKNNVYKLPKNTQIGHITISLKK